MIVLKSVKELYNLNLEGLALAATTDASPFSEIHRVQLGLEKGKHAFCSGIMMINLKYWRNNNAQNRLVEFAKKKRYPVYLHDQDALNFVFKNQWLELPPKWNRSIMAISPLNNYFPDNLEYCFEPAIIHYSSQLKPWLNVNFPDRNKYVKYLKISDYPNPLYESVTLKFRLSIYSKTIRYYISKYVYPVTPHIIDIIFNDIYTLFKFFILSITNRGSVKLFLLKNWEKKQRK